MKKPQKSKTVSHTQLKSAIRGEEKRDAAKDKRTFEKKRPK